MPVYPYRGVWPTIDPTAFIHPDAVLIGAVQVGAYSSVWPGVVIRGDVNFVRIGARSNQRMTRNAPNRSGRILCWVGGFQ